MASLLYLAPRRQYKMKKTIKATTTTVPTIPPIIPPFAPELKPLDLSVTVGAAEPEVLVLLVEDCEELDDVFCGGTVSLGGDVAKAPIPVNMGVPVTS